MPALEHGGGTVRFLAIDAPDSWYEHPALGRTPHSFAICFEKGGKREDIGLLGLRMDWADAETGRSANLYDLLLDRRGEGLGTKIVRQIIRMAREEGLAKFMITAITKKENSEKFERMLAAIKRGDPSMIAGWKGGKHEIEVSI
jgi:predicted acetyltransferase